MWHITCRIVYLHIFQPMLMCRFFCNFLFVLCLTCMDLLSRSNLQPICMQNLTSCVALLMCFIGNDFMHCGIVCFVIFQPVFAHNSFLSSCSSSVLLALTWHQAALYISTIKETMVVNRRKNMVFGWTASAVCYFIFFLLYFFVWIIPWRVNELRSWYFFRTINFVNQLHWCCFLNP